MVLNCAKTRFSLRWTWIHRKLSSSSRSEKYFNNENRAVSSSSSSISTDSNDDYDDRRWNNRRRYGGDHQNRQNQNQSPRIQQIQDPRIQDESSSSNRRHESSSSSLNFDRYLADQIDAARRSVLIRFAARSPNSYDDAFYEIRQRLAQFDVNVVSATTNQRTVHSPDGVKTFFLLETDSSDALQRFIRDHARSGAADHRLVPCRSRIIHFTADLKNEDSESSKAGDKKSIRNISGLDELRLNKSLRECLWLEEQMRVLVDETSLTETGTRLRFFVASLLEDAVRGVFPRSVCRPFGSTSNGFGDQNSDLDLDFAFEDSSATNRDRSDWLCAFRVKDDEPRKHTQNMVQLLGQLLRFCLPYCTDVSWIKNARVPIVKFNHMAGGFGCDATFENVTGVATAKILWTYSHYDRAIRPLVFVVRRWAAALEITRDVPGEWFSNFQLICLVIYFLQSRSAPSSGLALPSIRTLRRSATSDEAYGVIGDPERLRDVRNKGRNQQPRKKQQQQQRQDDTKLESLGDLLREFFLFYGHAFAFDRFGISLESGTTLEKSNASHAVLIDNPLENDHNIAKNVSMDQLQYFRSCARKASKMMNTKEFMDRSLAGKNAPWGLLALFEPALYEKVSDINPTASASSSMSSSESKVLLIDDVEIDLFESRKPSNISSKRNNSTKA